MSRLAPLAVLLILVTSLSACAAAQSAARSNRIEGRVLGEVDGERVPLGQVSINIVPVGEASDVVGVAVTRFSGHFAIDRLSDPIAHTERALIGNQSYQVKIIAPEYYLQQTTFHYGSGHESHDFILERKDSSLNNISLPPIDPEAQRVGTRGSVRKE